MSVAALTGAAVIALTGCGSGSGGSSTASKDPKAAFTTGVEGLGKTDVLTLTFKLDTTPDKLIGFAKESGDTLTPQVAQQISTAALVIETKTDDGTDLGAIKPGKTVKSASRITIQDNGRTLGEFRVLSDALYAQADLKTLLDLFQQQSAYATLTARAAQMPAFAQAFVQGKWVSLDLNALKALSSQFGANASPNASQTQKLLADLRAAVDKDVTVTRVGSDAKGDHLKMTTQSRQFVTDLMQAIGADVPGAGLATGSFKSSDVPEHSIVVDAWVKDGVLSTLSVDIVQFAKPSEVKPGDSLPVVLQFERSGDDVSRPAGATQIDTTALFTLLGSLSGK